MSQKQNPIDQIKKLRSEHGDIFKEQEANLSDDLDGFIRRVYSWIFMLSIGSLFFFLTTLIQLKSEGELPFSIFALIIMISLCVSLVISSYSRFFAEIFNLSKVLDFLKRGQILVSQSPDDYYKFQEAMLGLIDFYEKLPTTFSRRILITQVLLLSFGVVGMIIYLLVYLFIA